VFKPNVRDRASFFPENIEPLKQAKLKLVDNGEEILPEIKVFCVDGHTRGMQWVQIGSGKDTLAYAADLIPTSHHIRVPYVMGYDLSAELVMEEKEAFLETAMKEEWIVMFEHDAEISAGTITQDEKGRFVLGQKISIPALS